MRFLTKSFLALFLILELSVSSGAFAQTTPATAASGGPIDISWLNPNDFASFRSPPQGMNSQDQILDRMVQEIAPAVQTLSRDIYMYHYEPLQAQYDQYYDPVSPWVPDLVNSIVQTNIWSPRGQLVGSGIMGPGFYANSNPWGTQQYGSNVANNAASGSWMLLQVQLKRGWKIIHTDSLRFSKTTSDAALRVFGCNLSVTPIFNTSGGRLCSLLRREFYRRLQLKALVYYRVPQTDARCAGFFPMYLVGERMFRNGEVMYFNRHRPPNGQVDAGTPFRDAATQFYGSSSAVEQDGFLWTQGAMPNGQQLDWGRAHYFNCSNYPEDLTPNFNLQLAKYSQTFTTLIQQAKVQLPPVFNAAFALQEPKNTDTCNMVLDRELRQLMAPYRDFFELNLESWEAFRELVMNQASISCNNVAQLASAVVAPAASETVQWEADFQNLFPDVRSFLGDPYYDVDFRSQYRGVLYWSALSLCRQKTADRFSRDASPEKIQYLNRRCVERVGTYESFLPGLYQSLPYGHPWYTVDNVESYIPFRSSLAAVQSPVLEEIKPTAIASLRRYSYQNLTESESDQLWAYFLEMLQFQREGTSNIKIIETVRNSINISPITTEIARELRYGRPSASVLTSLQIDRFQTKSLKLKQCRNGVLEFLGHPVSLDRAREVGSLFWLFYKATTIEARAEAYCNALIP